MSDTGRSKFIDAIAASQASIAGSSNTAPSSKLCNDIMHLCCSNDYTTATAVNALLKVTAWLLSNANDSTQQLCTDAACAALRDLVLLSQQYKRDATAAKLEVATARHQTPDAIEASIYDAYRVVVLQRNAGISAADVRRDVSALRSMAANAGFNLDAIIDVYSKRERDAK